MNSQVADLVGDRDGGRASTPRSHPYPFPLPIPLTKDHHCCKKTAHGRRSRFLHKLASGNDGNREVAEPKCDCLGPLSGSSVTRFSGFVAWIVQAWENHVWEGWETHRS